MKAPDLPDKYKILKSLGQGGMGAVFKALDKNLDKTVAVKVLASDVAGSDPVAFQRFQQEAKAAGRLKHNNLVEIMDFGITDNNEAYLVMDYVEGKTLKELIHDQNNIPLALILEIFRQIAAGMNHAHQNNVIHRDLKPANIIVSEDEDGSDLVKVIDFGIAKIADAEGAGGDLTRTNAIVGSPLYMCPEQIKGQGIDQRSDIYSLGCILYECLVHNPPFQGDTALDTINMHQFNLAPSINDGREQEPFPEALVELVAKCLEKSPDSRYQTMEELEEEIAIIVEELQTDTEAASAVSGTKSETTSLSVPSGLASQHRIRQSRFFRRNLFILGIFLIPVVASFYFLLARPVPEKRVSKDLGYAALGDEEINLKELKEQLQDKSTYKEVNLGDKTITRNMLQLVKKSRRKMLNCSAGTFVNPADLALVSDLTWLKVSDTNFNDEGAKAISTFENLTYLCSSCTDLTAKGIKDIARIKHLTRVELDGLVGLTAMDLAPLKDLPELEKLQMRGMSLDDTSLLALSKMPRLKTIYITNSSKLSKEAIAQFQRETNNCMIRASNDKQKGPNINARGKNLVSE